jgi:putative hydrolase
MKNRYVDIIAHPGNPVFPIDIDEILKAASAHNVLIEINNSSLGATRHGSAENCRRITQRASELGNTIILGSDAHICYAIGDFAKALQLLEDAEVPEEKVINTDVLKLKEYLRSKGKTI